jgi:GNAT superfamily N-acetyltransferase
VALRLTARVDLDVYYDADSARHDSRVLGLVTRDAFRAFFAHCPSVGFEYDGAPIGGVIFDGEAPHIAVLPEWQGRWGPLLRPMLRWLFGLKPEMIISVDDDNPQVKRFVEHCGWPAVGHTEGATLHRMTPDGARRVARVRPDAD